jgi:hypothetical protein
VSVTTPSTPDVPLSTATAFLVASATTCALAAAATRRSEWKGRAGEDGVAKMAAGGAAAARRKVCAAMAQAAATTARKGWWCWLLARWRDGRLAADKVGPSSYFTETFGVIQLCESEIVGVPRMYLSKIFINVKKIYNRTGWAGSSLPSHSHVS